MQWDVVCTSKNEGGLGSRKIKDWNKAFLARIVWLVFSEKETL